MRSVAINKIKNSFFTFKLFVSNRPTGSIIFKGP